MKKPGLKFEAVEISFLDSLFGTPTEWPRAVLDLRGKSGVYVIRAKNNKQVLYVGESHTGRLKKTFLRHFQAWSGKTAGATYNRETVEWAFVICPDSRALAKQDEMILLFKPRDNRQTPVSQYGKKNPKNENPF